MFGRKKKPNIRTKTITQGTLPRTEKYTATLGNNLGDQLRSLARAGTKLAQVRTEALKDLAAIEHDIADCTAATTIVSASLEALDPTFQSPPEKIGGVDPRIGAKNAFNITGDADVLILKSFLLTPAGDYVYGPVVALETPHYFTGHPGSPGDGEDVHANKYSRNLWEQEQCRNEMVDDPDQAEGRFTAVYNEGVPVTSVTEIVTGKTEIEPEDVQKTQSVIMYSHIEAKGAGYVQRVVGPQNTPNHWKRDPLVDHVRWIPDEAANDHSKMLYDLMLEKAIWKKR